MSQSTTDSGYALIGFSIPVIGLGMGLTMAPATDSIMGSVPRANAGIGSAVNDTTRQVGGALGVAVLGSILSTAYGNRIENVASALPPAQAALVRDSIGAAAQVAQRIGGFDGNLLMSGANAAFIHAMDVTLVAASAVAMFGALLSLAFLPARAPEEEEEIPAERVSIAEMGGTRP